MDTETTPSVGKSTPWEIVYHGSLFCIEKHAKKGFERAVRPPGVRLLLTNNEGNILLTHEFRSELGTIDIRLPGGKVFDDLDSFLHVRSDEKKLNEAVMRAAHLEAKQETGVDAMADLSVAHVSTLGASVEWSLYYITGTIVAHGEQALEEDEKERGIAVHFYTKDEIVSLLHDGKIQEERSAQFLSRYLARL